jgi:hypothetical protein|tara:strand:+ start:759 stop:974 length:216 start_codon:yes stop_codon:yes gene_type:complete
MTPEQLKINYKELFGSKEGEIILEDMGKRFGMNSTTFVPDSNETIFKEGQRSVLLFIQGMITKKDLTQQEE